VPRQWSRPRRAGKRLPSAAHFGLALRRSQPSARAGRSTMTPSDSSTASSDSSSRASRTGRRRSGIRGRRVRGRSGGCWRRRSSIRMSPRSSSAGMRSASATVARAEQQPEIDIMLAAPTPSIQVFDIERELAHSRRCCGTRSRPTGGRRRRARGRSEGPDGRIAGRQVRIKALEGKGGFKTVYGGPQVDDDAVDRTGWHGLGTSPMLDSSWERPSASRFVLT